MPTTVTLDQPGGSTYIVWNSGGRQITIGTRDQARSALLLQFGGRGKPDGVLTRVDWEGTSATHPQDKPFAGWNDLRIDAQLLWRRAPIGWLPRTRLVEFARALAAGDDEAAAALLESAEPAEPDAPKDSQ